MGNEQYDLIGPLGHEILKDFMLCLRVQRCCGLIQDENTPSPEKTASQGNLLPLAPAKLNSILEPLPKSCFIFLRQVFYKPICSTSLGSSSNRRHVPYERDSTYTNVFFRCKMICSIVLK